MIKAILIDDEIRGLKILEHLLGLHKEIVVQAACLDSAEAIQKINLLQPDLLILDINMPNYNGFEVLDHVKHKNFKVIFITAHNEFAVKAFQYSAVDYLLKPVDEAQFHNAIEKITSATGKFDFSQTINTLMHNISAMKNPMTMKICIPNVNGFSVVDSQQIMYCEADSCYTIFKMMDGNQIISSKTLQEYENVLDENIFFRIHRSFIINLSQIKEYHKGSGGSVIMINGVELEVSRRKKDEFLHRIKSVFI